MANEIPSSTTGTKDAKEILDAKKRVEEMKKELINYSKIVDGYPRYSIVPRPRNEAPEFEDEYDKLIENYAYTTLKIIFEVANFHLEEAKNAKTPQELKKNCQIVNGLYLGFKVFTQLTEIHSPVSVRSGARNRDVQLGVESSSYKAGIDCDQEPYSKLLSTVNLMNQARSKIKPVSVYIRPRPEEIYGNERDPRLNIGIPLNDSENSIETNKNIIVIRWDFERVSTDPNVQVRIPVLDLTWFGQDESVSYHGLNVGQFQGHHFALGESLQPDEVTTILNRFNSYMQIKENNS